MWPKGVMSEYLETIESLKKRFKIAAITDDWLGHPIVVFKTGGREEPPVLVTAGSLGVEVAGVYAALELTLQVDVERTVYILPSRDPTGFHEASYILSKILGENVSVKSVVDLRKLLTGVGAEFLSETGDLFLAIFKGVGIAASYSLDAHKAAELLEKEMQSQELADTLDGTRILITGRSPQTEGEGEMSHFLTVFAKEGKLFTYDDFSVGTVPEVDFVKNFVDREDLGMVVDLHESKNSPGFYVSQSTEPSSGELTILYLVLDQVRQYGMELASRETLESIGLKVLTEGLGCGKGHCGLVDYVTGKAYAFAFSTPLDKPLESRIRTLSVATLSALNAFAIAYV